MALDRERYKREKLDALLRGLLGKVLSIYEPSALLLLLHLQQVLRHLPDDPVSFMANELAALSSTNQQQNQPPLHSSKPNADKSSKKSLLANDIVKESDERTAVKIHELQQVCAEQEKTIEQLLDTLQTRDKRIQQLQAHFTLKLSHMINLTK